MTIRAILAAGILLVAAPALADKCTPAMDLASREGELVRAGSDLAPWGPAHCANQRQLVAVRKQMAQRKALMRECGIRTDALEGIDRTANLVEVQCGR